MSGQDFHSAALQPNLVANPRKTDIGKNLHTWRKVKQRQLPPSFLCPPTQEIRQTGISRFERSVWCRKGKTSFQCTRGLGPACEAGQRFDKTTRDHRSVREFLLHAGNEPKQGR